MADPLDQLSKVGAYLGDIVNWSKKNSPPGTSILPTASLGELLGNVVGFAGAPETAKDIKRVNDIVTGQQVQAATDILSAPTALYSLANAGVNWARDRSFDEIINDRKDYGKPQLPGAETAMDITNKLNTVGTAMGNTVAGEPAELQVLKPIKNFSSDPVGNSAQLAGSLGRIALGLLPAPEPAIAAIGALGAKAETGIKVVDAVTKGTAKGLEMLTPITFDPSKAGMIGNIVGGAGITAGLEAILGDEPQVQQAVAQTNQETAEAITRAKDIKDRKIIQAGMLPFDDWKDNAYAAAGIGGATIGALLLRRGMKGVSDALKPTTTLDAIVSDRTAPLRGSLDQIDPKTAKHYDAFSARHGVDGSISTAVEHNFDTGRLPDANVSQIGPVKPLQITPQRVVIDKYGALDPAEQDGFKKLMHYRTELDNRISNLVDLYPNLDKYLRYKNPQTGEWAYDPARLQAVLRNTVAGATDEGISVNFTGASNGVPLKTIDLYQELQALRRNPRLADLERVFKNDYQTLTKYIENLGLRTSSEAEKFRKTNINYSPNERDYGTNLWERTRVPRSGVDVPDDPITQRANYIQNVISKAMKDQNSQYWMQYMWNARNQGDAYARRLIERRATDIEPSINPQTGNIRVRYKDGRVNEYNAKETIVWRDDQGRAHVDFISDPVVRAALKQESPFLTNQVMYIADKLRQTQQLFQTGAATVLGAPFAPAGALMTAFTGAIKKPRELIGGPADQLLQAFTKGKMHLPGDVTNIVELPYAILADTGSALAHAIANGMDRSITQNGVMARMLGPGYSQLVANTMRDIWESSTRYKMHDLGISHSAGITDNGAYMTFVSNSVTKLSALGAGADAIKKVFNIVDQVHNIVSASPISQMVRKNASRLTPDQLTKYAREFAADPGKRALAPSAYENKWARGASNVLHAANTSLPYANITIQSMADFFREFKKRPIDMAIGTTVAVGIPALISTSWNAGLGPEYSDYQYNVRDASRQAQNLYFGVKGLPPEMGIEYPIDPFYRPFQVAATTLIGSTYGLFDGSMFKPHNDHVRLRMQELAWPRFKEVMSEAGDMSIGIQMPLPAELLVASQGYQPGQISPFKPLIKKPAENRMLGFDDERTNKYINDNIFGLQMDRKYDEIARVVLGTLGDRILESLRTFSRTSDAGAPTSDALYDVAQRETMRLKDGAKMFNGLLWAQSPKLNPYGVESTLLYQKRTGIRNLTEALNEASRAGMSGSKTRPGAPLAGAQQQMPTDPVMLQIAQQASLLNRQLDKAFMAPMKAIQDQIVSVQSSAKYTPKTQRSILNDLNNRLQDYQAAALTQIELFEHQLSKGLGRKVSLDRIRLEQGIDQFPPLQGN